jgi:NAD(P)H-flavin reductase
MVSLSMPSFRAKYHNQFELMHRFGGWTSLLLFWAQTILFTNSQSTNLWATPSFWMLLLITISIILPWLRLKKVTVKIENPSSHVALVKFDHGVTPFAGSSTAVSRSPLIEWHSFANVPSPHEEGFRLTISRAGDWTGQFIDDLPQKVWVKGIPTAGVGNIDKLFKRVVWIATGSGIGPTLPHLLAQEVPAHLVWSTRTPRETYGDALVDEILAVEPNALIWDTNESGRPDLVQLAYDAVQQFNAEAVIVIANKKLTWQVVTGMESRNIPAYGAIWDS